MNIDWIIKEAIRRILLEDEELSTMKPTAEWMQQKYNEFNSSLFDNKLPKCQLLVSPLEDNLLGQFCLSKTALQHSMLRMGVALYSDGDGYLPLNTKTFPKLMHPKIKLNSKYDFPEKTLENTLIHEMCHYYTCFAENGDARAFDLENQGHGKDFQAAAQMIASKTNNEVTITQIASAEAMQGIAPNETYNKSGYCVYMFDFNGRRTFLYTKDPTVADAIFHVKKDWTPKVTDNPKLIYFLKRYSYKTTTWTVFMNRKQFVNGYYVDKAPDNVIKEFENSNWYEYKPQKDE